MSKIKVRYFILKLLIWFGVIALCGFAAIYFEGFISYLFIIPISIMFAHGIELQHQALHNTGFKSKFLNRFIGFFLGLPLLVAYSDYQYNHLRHHRLLGTPENKEFFDYDTDKANTLWSMTPQLLMISHFKDVLLKMISSIWRPIKMNAPKTVIDKITNEYRYMLLILIIFNLLGIFIPFIYLVKLWLIPLLLAAPIHALVELPEHVGCDKNDTSVLNNTRTIRANKFATWFTNGNNFHIEHHWLPGIPIENLSKLHDIIYEKEKYLEITYREFYYKFFKQIISNTFKRNNKLSR